jgi:hypothetical protein
MFTQLESAVLDLLLDKQGEPYDTIRLQLAHATVTKREFSGVGFFTDIAVPADAPVRRDLADMTLGDVSAQMASLRHGTGFVLFVCGGTVTLLEGYTYDEPWPASTEGFTVHRSNSD